MRKPSCLLSLFGVAGVGAWMMAVGPASAQSVSPASAVVPDSTLDLHPHLRLERGKARQAIRKNDAAGRRRIDMRRFVALAGENPTQADIVPPPARPPEDKRLSQPSKAEAARKAGDSKRAAAAMTQEATPPRRAEPLPKEVQQFCHSTANAAAEARVAWQAARLTELAAKLRQRIAELEAKRAEYEDWLHRHDEALKEAKEDVVAIYSRMRPDSAAAQLADMDEVMAASVLSKLNSRVASAILAEMDPNRAARITNAMVGPVIASSGKKS